METIAAIPVLSAVLELEAGSGADVDEEQVRGDKPEGSEDWKHDGEHGGRRDPGTVHADDHQGDCQPECHKFHQSDCGEEVAPCPAFEKQDCGGRAGRDDEAEVQRLDEQAGGVLERGDASRAQCGGDQSQPGESDEYRGGQ